MEFYPRFGVTLHDAQPFTFMLLYAIFQKNIIRYQLFSVIFFALLLVQSDFHLSSTEATLSHNHFTYAKPPIASWKTTKHFMKKLPNQNSLSLTNDFHRLNR